MRKLFWLVFAILIGITSVTDSYGQFFSRRKHYTTIGAGISAMNYFGDLAPTDKIASADFSFTRPQLSFFAARKFHPRFMGKVQISFGRLQGEDFSSADPGDIESGFFRYARNLQFRNDIVEVTGVGVIDLFENRGTFLKRPKLIPYLYLGLGVIYQNPKGKTADGEWVALKPLKTEEKSYSRIQPIIPVGLGLRYKVTNNIDISFEFGYRYTFTDYLDDVSGNYKGLDKFDDPLAAAMSNRSGELLGPASGGQRDMALLSSHYGGRENVSNLPYQWAYPEQEPLLGVNEGEVRGNPSNNDLYFVWGFHVSYILVKGIQTPKFR